jgi:hypothetical protein
VSATRALKRILIKALGINVNEKGPDLNRSPGSDLTEIEGPDETRMAASAAALPWRRGKHRLHACPERANTFDEFVKSYKG